MTNREIRRAMGLTFHYNAGDQVVAMTFNHPAKGRRGYGELITTHKSNSRRGWWRFLISLENDDDS